MANKKHYIITSLVLGIIAAASAGLIGLTNLITRDQIAKNEQNKFNAGIAEIFGDEASAKSFESSVSGVQYIDSSYYVSQDENTIGWAVRCTGSNMYGKISLISGFDYDDKKFLGIYVITNEQTYASTLVENYIDPLNSGEVDLDDVKCGATYGATLIKDMVSAAQKYVDGIIYE